jgi:hypothetical protein
MRYYFKKITNKLLILKKEYEKAFTFISDSVAVPVYGNAHC